MIELKICIAFVHGKFPVLISKLRKNKEETINGQNAKRTKRKSNQTKNGLNYIFQLLYLTAYKMHGCIKHTTRQIKKNLVKLVNLHMAYKTQGKLKDVFS